MPSIQTISDDALDRFADGWTPEQVRNLVAKYREAKRVIDASYDVLCELNERIGVAKHADAERIELDEPRRWVDGEGFICGAEWARDMLNEALP